MEPYQGNGLPYGVRGMDFERFAWELRPDGKVHLFLKDLGGYHWTLHPGTSSGVLDLHETSVSSDGAISYKTLFMIRLEDLDQITAEIGTTLISGLLQQFRPLSLKWVRRRNISVVRDPGSTDAELAAITYKNRKKRLQINTEKLRDSIEARGSPDELLHMPDGSFTLLAVRRWETRYIGVGVKLTDAAGAARLFWRGLEMFLGRRAKWRNFSRKSRRSTPFRRKSIRSI
jgi:hypothetical protein